MPGDEKDSTSHAGKTPPATGGSPSLQEIIAAQKAKLQDKLDAKVDKGVEDTAKEKAGQDEKAQPTPPPTPAEAPQAVTDEHPEVAEARREAYEEAIGQGASEAEAHSQGDVVASMVQTQLDYEAEAAKAEAAKAEAAKAEAAKAEAAKAEAAKKDAQAPQTPPDPPGPDAEEAHDQPLDEPSATPSEPPRRAKKKRTEPAATPAKGGRRVSLLHLVMAMNTALVAVVVGRMLGLLPGGLGGAPAARVVSAEVIPAPPRSPEDPIDSPGAAEDHLGKGAELAWVEKDYAQAAQRYRRLLGTLKSHGGDALLADFYRLRIAECLDHLGETKDARFLYEKVSPSHSPIVAAVASYCLAALDEAGGQYLLGRMRAYRAIAALWATGGRSPLERDCDYLIARVLTRKVRSFHQAKEIIPWPRRERHDPFAGLDRRLLGKLLRLGSVSSHVWAPGEKVQITEAAGGEAGRKWNVMCLRTPVEEVIYQFASRDKGDVKWVAVNPLARLRTISLNLRAIGGRRFHEVVCGMGGLLARFTMTDVEIHDPQALSVMSKQRDLLAREAESVWRGFFLRAPKDPRIAVGRFALAGLSELVGDPAAAMREYQLISRRYRGTALAPEALVRCARIRLGKLRDYRGARADLYDLMDLWPEYHRSAEVNLLLGRVCMKAGLLEDATRTFKKLYHMNLSADSRNQACLGAGDCYRLRENYKAAAVWMVRYINLAKKGRNEDMARAYIVLGRAEAMDNRPDEAVRAFQRALGWGPTNRQYVAAALGIGRAWLAKEAPVSALSALKALRDHKLEPAESRDYVLLTARAYRQMGLPEKAQMILAQAARLPSLTDRKIRARILVELSRCCVDTGDLKDARKWLLEALPRLEAGKANWEATIELAEVCLKLGNPRQAVSLARELMKTRCDKAIRRRATEILVRGHVRQRDYKGAVEAVEALRTKKKKGARG